MPNADEVYVDLPLFPLSTPKTHSVYSILVYPPQGTGAVNITNGDVARLNPGEFLNDTLIEFGLKSVFILNSVLFFADTCARLWLAELHDTKPELADQIHLFSSFFYKKLSTKM